MNLDDNPFWRSAMKRNYGIRMHLEETTPPPRIRRRDVMRWIKWVCAAWLLVLAIYLFGVTLVMVW